MTENVRIADDVDSHWGKFVLVGLVTSVIALAVIAYLTVRGSDGPELTSPPSYPGMNTPFMSPGIRQPATVAAADAQLDEQAQVIGISVADKHRAYVVRAFDRILWHVVNDLLDDIPVSVTYCDRCDLVRVFTSPRRGSPLDLMLGGWRNGRMMLRLGDASFLQDGSDIGGHKSEVQVPAEYPHERTTWTAWKTAHPDTDVYLGSDEKSVMQWPPKGK
jgi:hypothetical protein